MKSVLFFIAMSAIIVAMFEEHGARNTDSRHFATQWHHYAVALGHLATACIGLIVIVAIIEWAIKCHKQLAEIPRLRKSLARERRYYKTVRYMEQR